MNARSTTIVSAQVGQARKNKWSAHRVRLLAHEYGLRVDGPIPEDRDLRRIRRRINDNRANGRGPTLPLSSLRRTLAYEWYGAVRARERHVVMPRVDARLAELLNADDNGFVIVPVSQCRCGRSM